MNAEIVAAWIGVGGATLVGGFGWVFAGIANSRAKKANKLAETANSIAADALAQAAASNKLAEDANELSEQANTLSERTLLHASEESFVQWLPEWDIDRSILSLINRGRDVAHQPSAVITGEGLHQVSAGDDTAPGEKVSVPLPQIVEKRARVPQDRFGTIGGQKVTITRRFEFPIDIVVLWKTEHGFQRHERIEFEIREGKHERFRGIW